MDKFDVNVSDVKKLIGLVESHHLDELTVEEDGVSITIRGKVQRNVSFDSPGEHPESLSVGDDDYSAEDDSEETQDNGDSAGRVHNITAPLVGVFYRAHSPDAPPFVDVGDHIEVGTEVGLIEAMKVFSPIPSDVAGEVIDVPVANGKLVQHGDVLIRVRIPEESAQT